MRLKKAGFFLALSMLTLTVVALTSSIAQNNRCNAHDYAIVFSPEVAVKSAPAESATELFILHEGTKVSLREQVGDWVEVTISDGSRGWMPLAAIVAI